MGSYYGIDVTIGTPPQTMNLVADTGSDAFVVTSHGCEQTGSCGGCTNGKCFEPLDSDSFAWSSRGITLNYGSGGLDALITGDNATLNGGLSATLTDSVLLVIQSDLRITGNFDGILGLGPPSCGDDPMSRLFLEHAEKEFFSICFNPPVDGNLSDGVLRVGQALSSSSPVVQLRSAGSMHWGLGLSGIWVGGTATSLCKESDDNPLKNGVATPCGFIPDSGTTEILAPAAHVAALKKSICIQWDKCSVGNTSVDTTNPDYEGALDDALLLCESLDSLPSLTYKVIDEHGQSTQLVLPGVAYVIEVRKELWDGDQERDGCYFAMEADEYTTRDNGPVTIGGMPFFFEYQIGFDILTRKISFSTDPCVACTAGANNPISGTLVERHSTAKKITDRSAAETAGKRTRAVRRVSGRPRYPSHSQKTRM